MGCARNQTPNYKLVAILGVIADEGVSVIGAEIL